ncbi:MAG: class I SAM-dependent methyltransferase [Bdellovibrionales bacterium]|nr:class I SAM-dependent methyltransferase [Bdellovibrionales bacterium]
MAPADNQTSGLFSKQAEIYARFRPRYPRELYDYLLSLVPARALAFDVATGNGQAADTLAQDFARVIASDISGDQIKNAKPNPKIEYRVEPAETLGAKDKSVDLVTVAQAAHWFDFKKFYPEVKRVLKPGGVIAIFGYGFFENFGIPSMDRVIEEFSMRELAPYWKPQVLTLWHAYSDIPFPFQELKAPRFSIQIEANLDELMGYFSTWSAVQLYKDQHGVDPTVRLRAQLVKEWGNSDARRTLEWKLALKVARI